MFEAHLVRFQSSGVLFTPVAMVTVQHTPESPGLKTLPIWQQYQTSPLLLETNAVSAGAPKGIVCLPVKDREQEDFLATDDLFVDYFNKFLSLPTFPEPLRFNKDLGGFEVVTNAQKDVANQIKAVARSYKAPSQIYNATRAITDKPLYYQVFSDEPQTQEEIKTSFLVTCLNKEQGIQWIKQQRLPAFLQSDLYLEYRLAKLLQQTDNLESGVKLTIDTEYRPFSRKKSVVITQQLEDDAAVKLMKTMYVCMGEASTTQTKQWISTARQANQLQTTTAAKSRMSSGIGSDPFGYQSRPNSGRPASAESLLGEDGLRVQDSAMWTGSARSHDRDSVQSEDWYSSKLFGVESPTRRPPTRSKTPLHENFVCMVTDDQSQRTGAISRSTVYKESGFGDDEKEGEKNAEENEDQDDSDDDSGSSERSDSSSKSESSDTTDEDEEHPYLNVQNVEDFATVVVAIVMKQSVAAVTDVDIKEIPDFFDTEESEEPDPWFRKQRVFELQNCKGFEAMRKFLEGSNGDKYWSFWLDIDRGKLITDPNKHQSYLVKMRERYLQKSSPLALTHEMCQALGLGLARDWTMDQLADVQARVLEPLLLYWAPRFLLSQRRHTNMDQNYLYFRQKLNRPKSAEIDPQPRTITIIPLRPKTCIPRVKLGQRQKQVSRSADLALRKSARSDISSISGSSWAGSEDSSPDEGPQNIRNIVARKFSLPSSNDSVFLGSSRMEQMLQALYHDRNAGYFFTQFCERSGNKLWSNSIHCWTDLQTYHTLFYADVLDPFVVKKKAQYIHSRFVVAASPEDIGCSQDIRNEVYKNIDPPFEELFDSAEEYILHVLVVPWQQMIEGDKHTYSKVELFEQKRHLETKSRQLLRLQKKGLLRELTITPEAEELEESPYDDTIWAKLPDQFKKWTFEGLVHNRLELEHFRKFLADNFASIDLQCWMDIEAFRRLSHLDNAKRDDKAKDIKSKYLNKKYFFGPNSPATKEQQNKVMEAGGGWGKILQDRPPTTLLLEAQKYVKERLEKKWLPMFLSTTEFQERQRPKINMDDVAEDVMVHKQRKRQQVWKMLDSKLMSSTRDIIAFRRALMNPVTSQQFRKFVSVKGENLENDVLFWLEIQKYKDMVHAHVEDSFIQQKIAAIIHCFIDSSLPPSVQIDIPPDQADRILEHRRELGPYIFREAQLTVFRLLLHQWGAFCEFRQNMAEEKILTTLERQRKRARERERARQKAYEEEQAKREALKAGEGEDEDAGSDFGSQMDEETSQASLEKVTWSYGNYMAALEREEQMNKLPDMDNISLSTLSDLSGLTSNTSMKTSRAESVSSEVTKETLETGKSTLLDVPKKARPRKPSIVSIKDGGKVVQARTGKELVPAPPRDLPPPPQTVGEADGTNRPRGKKVVNGTSPHGDGREAKSRKNKLPALQKFCVGRCPPPHRPPRRWAAFDVPRRRWRRTVSTDEVVSFRKFDIRWKHGRSPKTTCAPVDRNVTNVRFRGNRTGAELTQRRHAQVGVRRHCYGEQNKDSRAVAMPTPGTTLPPGMQESVRTGVGREDAEVISIYLRCREIARDFDRRLVSDGSDGERSGRVARRVTPIRPERDFVRFPGWTLLQQTPRHMRALTERADFSS
ncbi:GTPase activator [Branchiostoma belcheri]|nr:GTPase activator [Branchiostoma belcheri]